MTQSISLQDLITWCDENVVVSQYTLSTRYLSSSKFGHVGFQGHVTYEVKGNPLSQLARWLTPLAHLALFSGIGYKTTMGMGQARCTNLSVASPAEVTVTGGNT